MELYKNETLTNSGAIVSTINGTSKSVNQSYTFAICLHGDLLELVADREFPTFDDALAFIAELTAKHC